jgi:hypothetical protein
VVALYEIKREWARARDFFPAQVAALQFNAFFAHQGDDKTERVEPKSANDFLRIQYPDRKKKDVNITPKHDPDRGAQGNWRAMKSGLKQLTKAARKKRAKLKVGIPPKHGN